MKKMKNNKVFVGLSGGVDSSVSAALLKEAGYDVYGVFIKVWSFDWNQDKQLSHCSAREDRLDAMRICARLNIPFYTLDLEKEYKREVVDYMIAEYKAGRTPNPDVMCNKYIKFGGFFDWAMKNGADFVATGHYARTLVKSYKVHKAKSKKKTKTEKLYKLDEPYELLTGVDTNKDQSYFLWTLTQEQLSKTLFPVGHLEKPVVRRLAKKFDLNTATKKDSQGVCFIGKFDMKDFLKNFIKTKSGKVLNDQGEIIGTHEGIELYTLGQRHGFEITKKTNNDKRYFIIAKDFKKNILIVSDNLLKQKEVRNKEIKLKDINWTLGLEPDFKKEYFARIRYRQPLEKCRLEKRNKDLIVNFKNPQKSPALGQSVVIYNAYSNTISGQGEVCLGGGIMC